MLLNLKHKNIELNKSYYHYGGKKFKISYVACSLYLIMLSCLAIISLFVDIDSILDGRMLSLDMKSNGMHSEARARARNKTLDLDKKVPKRRLLTMHISDILSEADEETVSQSSTKILSSINSNSTKFGTIQDIECAICFLTFDQSTNSFAHWADAERKNMSSNCTQLEFPECHGSQMCMPCINRVCTFQAPAYRYMQTAPLPCCPICRSNVRNEFLEIAKVQSQALQPSVSAENIQVRYSSSPTLNGRSQPGYVIPQPVSTLDQYHRFLFDTGRFDDDGNRIYSSSAADADLSLSALGLRRYLRYHYYRFIYSSSISTALGSNSRNGCVSGWADISVGFYANILCSCFYTEQCCALFCCPCFCTQCVVGFCGSCCCCFNNCCCGLCLEDFCYCSMYPHV